jgi:hypothetical protein
VHNIWDLAASPAAADRAAQRWLDSLPPGTAVGDRHHIVPKFLLAKFATPDGRIRVRDRSTGDSSLRSIGDLAVRDFYTSVTITQELDGRLEAILSEVEGAMATILRERIDALAFVKQRPFTTQERLVIDTFVSIQYIRGMRARRSLEIVADYGMKLVNQGRLTPEEIETLDIVPHPNDHLRMFGTLSEQVFEYLAPRPLVVVHLDQPLLLIGDEPVVMSADRPLPPFDPEGLPNVTGSGIDSRDIIHLQGNKGVGFATAEEILLAVSPTTVLVFGPMRQGWDASSVHMNGKEAAAAAAEHNSLVLDASVDWVAAHPDHPTFADMHMPEAKPIVRVSDGGSAPGRRANSTTQRRPINRLRASDFHEIQGNPDDPC